MKAAAEQLARDTGIVPLNDDEPWPVDYFLVNHFTGLPVVKKRTAAVRKP